MRTRERTSTGRRERPPRRRVVAGALVSLVCSSLVLSAETEPPPAGGPGGPALAILAAKVLTMADDAPVVDRGVVIIRDGAIVGVGRQGELELPPDSVQLDVGEHWVMPGLVELHSHVGGTMDINDAVYQANPGLRVTTAVRPLTRNLKMAVAGGVTTILFIPGSATTMGGQGVLMKTGLDTYEESVLRDPGCLKLAQADNPKSWGWGMGRLSLNWQIRDSLRLGVAYARRWAAYERDGGEEPRREIQHDIFRALVAGEAQILAHTQVQQVVYQTCRIVAGEFGLPVFIGHGTMNGFLASEYANALGVPAILGPRSISAHNVGRAFTHDGKIVGVAAEYQQRNHDLIGFNTDAPVVPQEELALQSAMGVRYGFDDSEMGTIRGLTIVPARVCGFDHRIGSLEAGKDADLVVITGHPSDPRSSVERVFIEGRDVYDAKARRRF